MLHALGAQLVDQGRYKEGEALLTESVAEARQAGDSYDEALSSAHLGIAAWGRGDLTEATARLEAARTLGRAAGHPMPTAVATRYLGLIAAEAGNYAQAAELHREHAFGYDPDSMHFLARAVPDVASLAAVRGKAEQAASLFGAAAGLAAALGFAPAWPERGAHERAIAAARAALANDAFEAAVDAGRGISREQILREVEAVLDAAASEPQPRVAEGDRAVAPHGLTPREFEVLRLVAAGRSNREIAEALFIGVPTVKRHLSNILGKLNLPSRSALNTYAHIHGLT
jgi:ATP/maltotriose-dependent transcriptional regulator MalT